MDWIKHIVKEKQGFDYEDLKKLRTFWHSRTISFPTQGKNF